MTIARIQVPSNFAERWSQPRRRINVGHQNRTGCIGEANPGRRRQSAATDTQGSVQRWRPARPIYPLVDKVARNAYRVTDEDITAAETSGLSEDQVFEIVVCAAVGRVTRQYDSTYAALHAAIRKE